VRLILDQTDLLSILSRHFGEMLEPSRVQVRSEPFEVELFGIPLAVSTEGAGRMEPPCDAEAGSGVRSDRNGSREPPPITPEETSDDPSPILRQSMELERELGRAEGEEDRRTRGGENGG
jgi:hypothetical protein